MHLAYRVLLAAIMYGFICQAHAQPATSPQSLQPVPSATFTYKLPEDGITAPSISEVATAIAREIPLLSEYGALRDGRIEYDSIAIGAGGTTRSGVSWTEIWGVSTKVTGREIVVDYINGKRMPDGRHTTSTTQTKLIVSQSPTDTAKFQLEVGATTEQIGRAMLVFKQKPIDSIANVTADLLLLIPRLKVALPREKNHTVEFNDQYAPPSVISNFERVFKKLRSAEPSGDSREGNFLVVIDAFTQATVNVKVSPYRSGSKVLAKFSLPFELRADSTSSFNPNGAQQVEKALRSAAAQ